DPVPRVKVWVVASTDSGYRDSPLGATTDSEGGFQIQNVPRTIYGDDVAVVVVQARAAERRLFGLFSGRTRGITGFRFGKEREDSGWVTTRDDPVSFEAVDEVMPGSIRQLQLSVLPLAMISVLFFVGVFVPLIGGARRWKYRLCLITAFSLT